MVNNNLSTQKGSDEIKTILYATDLGDHTRPAFHMAVNLAKVYKAKMLFLYVIAPLSSTAMSAVNVYFPSETLEEMNVVSMDEVTERAEKRIKEFCAEEIGDEELPGGELVPHVIEGMPAATIVKTAETMDADLVVMGNHGHGMLDTLFLGSVADKVVHNCSKPVLLVPIQSG